MCDLVAGTMAALSVASTGMSMWSGYEQASAQAAAAQMQAVAQQQQAIQQQQINNQIAIQDYYNTLTGIDKQEQEAATEAAEQMSERTREALKAQSALRVASGEMGVSGVTPGRLESEQDFLEASDLGSIRRTYDSKIAEAEYSKRTARDSAQNRMKTADVSGSYITQPSLGMTLASGALASAVSGIGAYHQYKPSTKTT